MWKVDENLSKILKEWFASRFGWSSTVPVKGAVLRSG